MIGGCGLPLLVEAVAVGAEDLVAVAPVLLYLDKELEEDLLLEESLHVATCHRADLLDGDTAVADDDALLAVALDDDEGLDVDTLVLFLEGFDDDFDGVGDLLLIVEEDLLTDDLGDEEACGTVGQCVLIEVGGEGGMRLSMRFFKGWTLKLLSAEMGMISA